jgi:DNA-binding transcriptional LysR family regulator
MKISLRQLAVFDAVATLGRVSAAADQLSMSQSAASASLREFQLLIDRPPLFKRVGRYLKLTPEGERLRPQVRNMLNAAKAIEAPTAAESLSGSLIVGASDAVGNYIIPELAIAFRRLHPAVIIKLWVAPIGEIIARLGRLELETAVIDHATRAPGTVMTALGSHRLMLVAPPGHLLAGRTDITASDLQSVEWCMPSRGTLSSMQLNQAIEGKLENVSVSIECTSNEALLRAVRSGGGIALLPEKMVADDLRAGALVRLDAAAFELDQMMHIVSLKDVKRPPCAVAFERFMISAYESDGYRSSSDAGESDR